MEMVKKTRLNLELPKTVKDRILELRDENDISTMSQVVLNAISLYDRVISEKSGKSTTIVFRNEQTNIDRIVEII